MCAVIGSLDLLSQLDNFLQHDADEGESGEEESGEGDEILAAELEANLERKQVVSPRPDQQLLVGASVALQDSPSRRRTPTGEG